MSGWLSLGQLLFGVILIWISLQREQIRARGGQAFQNQRFMRTCFFLLGTSMLLFSLWGLWLQRK